MSRWNCFFFSSAQLLKKNSRFYFSRGMQLLFRPFKLKKRNLNRSNATHSLSGHNRRENVWRCLNECPVAVATLARLLARLSIASTAITKCGQAGNSPRKRGHFQNMAAPVASVMAFSRSKQTTRTVKPGGTRQDDPHCSIIFRGTIARASNATQYRSVLSRTGSAYPPVDTRNAIAGEERDIIERQLAM